MDDPIAVDDLFGDPADPTDPTDPTSSLDLGNLTGRHITSDTKASDGDFMASTLKGLPQRLDEMRLCGCNQKITWSRLGALVYISADGQHVCARHLRCSPEDGSWALSGSNPGSRRLSGLYSTSNPQDHQDISYAGRHTGGLQAAHDAVRDASHRGPPVIIASTGHHGNGGGHPFVHLAFNEAGTELAVVDGGGRVAMYSMSPFAVDGFVQGRASGVDPINDGRVPVGMMWLGMNKRVLAFHKATKADGRWSYLRYPRQPVGPLNPSSRAALVCVTRSGRIRFLYQQIDMRWAESCADLCHIGYSDGLLTHAAMTPSEGHSILLVTHAAYGQMCVYRLQINWEVAPGSSTTNPPRPGGPPPLLTVPRFAIQHVKTEVLSKMFARLEPGIGTNGGSGIDGDGVGNREAKGGDGPLSDANYSYTLTHLQVMPTSPGGQTGEPCVVGIFSLPIHPHEPPLRAGPMSILMRWRLESTAQTLHPSFNEVPTKKSNVQLRSTMILRKQNDMPSDRLILAMDYIEAGGIVALTHDDGSIVFFDVKTMKHAAHVGDSSNTVISIVQAGYTFPPSSPGLHIAFSPNTCLAVMLEYDGRLNLRYIEHGLGSEDGVQNQNGCSSVFAALALAYSRSCGVETCSDDVIIVAMRLFNGDSRKTFLYEVYRALQINVDTAEEKDNKVINNQYLQKCLSMQSAFGFRSRFQPRTLAAAVPYVTLNLRQICIIFAYIFHFNNTYRETESYDVAVLQILQGDIRWALEFVKYLIDDLFELADRRNGLFARPDYSSPDDKCPTTLALILVLSGISRSFLKYICASINVLADGYKAAVGLSLEAYHHCNTITQLVDHCALRVDACERFLVAVGAEVLRAYARAGLGGSAAGGTGIGVNKNPNMGRELQWQHEQRSEAELSLIVRGEVPDVLRTAADEVLNVTLPSILGGRSCVHSDGSGGVGDGNAKEENEAGAAKDTKDSYENKEQKNENEKSDNMPPVNRLALYMTDYAWLGVGGDARTAAFRRAYDLDVLTRMVVPRRGVIPELGGPGSGGDPGGGGIGIGKGPGGGLAPSGVGIRTSRGPSEGREEGVANVAPPMSGQHARTNTPGPNSISVATTGTLGSTAGPNNANGTPKPPTSHGPGPGHETGLTHGATAIHNSHPNVTIAASTSRKVCVRCCEVSVDAETPRQMTAYMRMAMRVGTLRACYCGSLWVIEGRE